VPEDGIETLRPDGSFWLSHVRLRITSTSLSHGGLLLLNGRNWITNVTLEGPASAGPARGVDIASKANAYFRGASSPQVAP
jgi:hypothetical protein